MRRGRPPLPALRPSRPRLQVEAFEQLDVLLDAAAGELGDVRRLPVLPAAHQERFLDLEQLAVALDLSLQVGLVEGGAGFLLWSSIWTASLPFASIAGAARTRRVV